MIPGDKISSMAAAKSVVHNMAAIAVESTSTTRSLTVFGLGKSLFILVGVKSFESPRCCASDMESAFAHFSVSHDKTPKCQARCLDQFRGG